jgi:solute carrier family 35 protein F1/2
MHAPRCVRYSFPFSHKKLNEHRILIARWAIPVCMFFCWVYMRTRYHWTQLLGVFICISGLGLLVASDQLTKKDWQAVSRRKGDGFMIAGATLYGFSEFAI